MYLPRMSVPTRGRGKTICSLCHLSLRNSFAARSVCLCRRKWTREATLMYQPRAPRRLSLSLQLARGRLRFVTSHSRFALASLRSKARNEAPEEETADVLFGR